MELKKKDWMLIAIIVCVAACAFFLNQILRDTGSGSVVVKVSGKMEGTYSLREDRIVEINHGSNILQIKNGEAEMTEADCPDLLCVHHKAVSENGESIICLPNKVFVEIRSKEKSKIDALTN
ncbi:MAG: NusG domain II-containing protein [Eubacteriales bacterium]|nr:NusG domain II-containing protein [Eubacteriales bacterium]